MADKNSNFFNAFGLTSQSLISYVISGNNSVPGIGNFTRRIARTSGSELARTIFVYVTGCPNGEL
jgi:hypothetical protein